MDIAYSSFPSFRGKKGSLVLLVTPCSGTAPSLGQAHLLNTNPHWGLYSSPILLSVLHNFAVRWGGLNAALCFEWEATGEFKPAQWLQRKANAQCPLRSWKRICLSGICLGLEMIERWQKHLCHKRIEPIYVGRTFWAEGNSLCQRNSRCCPTGGNCFPRTVIMVLKVFFLPEFTTRLRPLGTSGKTVGSNQKSNQGKKWSKHLNSKKNTCVS